MLNTKKIFDGTSVKQPRTLSCSNYVNSKMEFAVGRIYVQRYFLEDQKKDVSFRFLHTSE
jgi:predicted metalloendopeptidase